MLNKGNSDLVMSCALGLKSESDIIAYASLILLRYSSLSNAQQFNLGHNNMRYPALYDICIISPKGR